MCILVSNGINEVNIQWVSLYKWYRRINIFFSIWHFASFFLSDTKQKLFIRLFLSSSIRHCTYIAHVIWFTSLEFYSTNFFRFFFFLFNNKLCTYLLCLVHCRNDSWNNLNVQTNFKNKLSLTQIWLFWFNSLQLSDATELS